MPARPVFLLGMMGAGKTRVGREFASLRESVFIDLDTRVERLFGAAIAQLFEHGEAYFRACERAALTSLVREPGFASSAAVVATGGGVVVDPQNLETMRSVGRLAYLEADVETLAARLSSDEQRRARPLLGEPASLAEDLQRLLAAREQAYRGADLIVDGRSSASDVAARLFAECA